MISICMIVKNEGAILEKCLEAIKSLNYEIVIIDTGSTDNTKEIALKYTDKVYDFMWCDDFSKARNFSVENATNDYIVILDADEILTYIDKEQLQNLLLENEGKVGRLGINNEYERENNEFKYMERVSRVFNRKLFKYHGTIHEQIISKDSKSYSYYDVPIEINHIGYSNEELERKNKIDRNISMLKKSINQNPNDPYIFFQLGKSYYLKKEFGEAKVYFEEALNLNVDTKYEYVQNLIESYGYTLINLQKYEEAMIILNVYEEYKWSGDFLFLVGLIYMNNGFFKKAIEEFEKCTKLKKCSMEGVNNYLAYYNMGVILECLGERKKAMEYYSKCGKYKLALTRLQIIKEQ